MAFGWLKKAVKSAGKGIGKVAKGAAKGVGKVAKTTVKVAVAPVKVAAKAGRTIGKTLGKVPVVGAGLKGVFDLTVNAPFQVAGQVASGERIDKVAVNALKAHVRSVQAVAPYAQTVISVVPAVGPGINGAIGAGLALASGQPITKALAEGVKSALPGGPLAKSIFSATQSVIEGKPLSAVAMNALPLGASEKKGLQVALNVTTRIAKGERVDKALLSQADNALKLLPKDALKAFQVGTAVAEAQRLQKIAVQHVNPAALDKLKAGGNQIIRSSPVLSSASAILKSSASKAGYEVGTAVMATKQPQPFHVAAIRTTLNPQQKAGFDVAVAAHTGMVKYGKAVPATATPAQKLGYLVTRGISKTTTAPAIVKVVKTNPATKAGTEKAIQHIEEKPTGLWKKFKIWLLGE